MQVTVAGSAVIGFDPSPAESVISERGHDVDVSVMVNLTLRGAAPEVGATPRVALVRSVPVPPPTVTVTD